HQAAPDLSNTEGHSTVLRKEETNLRIPSSFLPSATLTIGPLVPGSTSSATRSRGSNFEGNSTRSPGSIGLPDGCVNSGLRSKRTTQLRSASTFFHQLL